MGVAKRPMDFVELIKSADVRRSCAMKLAISSRRSGRRSAAPRHARPARAMALLERLAAAGGVLDRRPSCAARVAEERAGRHGRDGRPRVPAALPHRRASASCASRSASRRQPICRELGDERASSARASS